MKRLLCVLLVSALLLGLCACGSKEDEILGIWTINSVKINGSSFTIAEVEAMGDYSLSDVQLVVKDGGQAYMTAAGESIMVDWEKIPSGIKIGIRDCEIKGGILCIDRDGQQMFLKKTSDSQTIQVPSEAPSVEPSKEPTETPSQTAETPTPEPSPTPSEEPTIRDIEYCGFNFALPMHYEEDDDFNPDSPSWTYAIGSSSYYRISFSPLTGSGGLASFENSKASLINSISEQIVPEGFDINTLPESPAVNIPGGGWFATCNDYKGLQVLTHCSILYNEETDSAMCALFIATGTNSTANPFVQEYLDMINATELVPELQASGTTSGDLGDYHIEIKGASLTKDYDGNPIIVVTYDWTNNSDKTTSAILALIDTAYQNGVELDSAYLLGDDNYDLTATSKKIRPGATLRVQSAYKLEYATSTIEFEISELFNYTGDSIVVTFDPTSLS